MRNKIIKGAAVAVLAGVALTGCSVGNNSTSKDNQATDTQLQRYQANQPVPANDWSQYRQTVIDVNEAQVHGVATTTFFFNQGVQDPIKSCPSVGFAVPHTTQLTDPQQIGFRNSPGGGYDDGVINQAEPNGVYTGDSDGTYVVCVEAGGAKAIDYWEGFVETEGGSAHWDTKTHSIVLTGKPTVQTTTRKGETKK